MSVRNDPLGTLFVYSFGFLNIHFESVSLDSLGWPQVLELPASTFKREDYEHVPLYLASSKQYFRIISSIWNTFFPFLSFPVLLELRKEFKDNLRTCVSIVLYDN